ncbi:MAG: hypothetical protein AMXMBFR47_36910 [Planctomycetota bacterium]
MSELDTSEFIEGAKAGKIPVRALVANHLSVACDLPAELIPGHMLRPASEEELSLLKSSPGNVIGDDLIPRVWPEAMLVVERVRPAGVGGLTGGFLAIEQAARLTEIEMDLSVMMVGGQIWKHTTIGRPWLGNLSPIVETRNVVTADWISLIQDLDRQLALVESSHPEIPKAVDLFRLTTAIDRHHVLYPLGLFMTLERLMTHNPQGRYDSLTHQLSAKFPLLERRFDSPLDYSVFTGGLDSCSLWKSLYAYRSKIAHGGTLDFKEGKLRPLKNSTIANTFLLSAAKALLRHALKEPALVLDLRNV